MILLTLFSLFQTINTYHSARHGVVNERNFGSDLSRRVHEPLFPDDRYSSRAPEHSGWLTLGKEPFLPLRMLQTLCKHSFVTMLFILTVKSRMCRP